MSTDQTTTGSSVTKSSGWFTVLPSLATPICVGLSLYFGLQYLINENHLTNETVLRYIDGHPVSRLTVGMFLVGLASLTLIGINVFAQFAAEPKIQLDDLPEPDADKPSPAMGIAPLPPTTNVDYGRSDAETAVEHGESLVDFPKSIQQHYLWSRLVNSLHYIYRTGSVAGVEDEMKYLAEMDIERQQQRYSLSRILIWATPMLGFLGTVLGISQALGGISVGPDNDFQQMMGGLQGSLYIAFDTTALALSLSMVLMFCQFLVDRFEVQLLELVDQKTRREIARQFDLSKTSVKASGLGATGVEVLEATRDVVRNQTEIWRDSIKAAENAWTSTLTQTSDVVRENLSAALDENVANLAHYLGESIEKADLSIAHRWEQWQTLLSNNARLMKEHQESLLCQTEKIQTVVQTLDDTTSFKEAMQHQNEAIKATTKMHDVLARVANEVSAQSKQMQKSGDQQAQLLQTSSDAIIKNQQAFEKRIANFTMDLPLALPVIDNATTRNHEARDQPPPVAEKPARRRDPKKPVMFLRSEAVTQMRQKTQTTKAKTGARTDHVTKPTAKAAGNVPVMTAVLDKKKKTISIQNLRQQLGIKSVEKTEVTSAQPTLLMPETNRLSGRVRSAEVDDAERLSLVETDRDQTRVQRKKAA